MEKNQRLTLTLEGIKFTCQLRDANTLMVCSHHPYDETEYHWAAQTSKSSWRIYRSGKLVKDGFSPADGTLNDRFLQIAMLLLMMDREANLKPTPAIW